MKHLIAQEHHPHLKKRAFLELSGLALLLLVSFSQREVITNAVSAIRESDVLYLIILMSIYWIMLPLTAISYKMLAYKKIPILSTSLAQLAAAGPGRIIPGGLGHISIGAIHLRNLGLNMQRAVLIPVANNIMGLMVNAAVVMLAIIYHPSLVESALGNFTAQTALFTLVFIVAALTLLQWLLHARKTRKAVKKVNNQWRHLYLHLKKHPKRLLVIILISLLITLGHALMLKLSGLALSVEVSLIDAILALSAGVILGGAIPTPGGLGAVEAGTTSALVVLGYSAPEATSVALLFRTATYWQPLLPGLISYLYLRERDML